MLELFNWQVLFNVSDGIVVLSLVPINVNIADNFWNIQLCTSYTVYHADIHDYNSNIVVVLYKTLID